MIENQIYNADFILEAQHLIPDKSVDLIVTDPPYLIGYDYWDNHSIEFHHAWLKECKRILKDNGTIWSFMAYCDKSGQTFLGYEFYNIMKQYFYIDLRNSVVWARQKGRGSSKHLKSQREDIYYGTSYPPNVIKPTWNNLKMLREVCTPYMKDGRPRGWFLDENGKRVRWTGLGNVWTYTAPQYNSITDKQIHSAQKPVMMIERMIRLSSNEGDLVFDPFMGSGTTAIAAKISNRKYCGFELDKNNFALLTNRIKTFNPKDYNGFSNVKIKVEKQTDFFNY